MNSIRKRGRCWQWSVRRQYVCSGSERSSATGEGEVEPADRYPSYCNNCFAAPSASAVLRLLQSVVEVFLNRYRTARP